MSAPRGRMALGGRAPVAALLVTLSLGLGGCSTISGWFSADKPKPKPLEPIDAPIAGRVAWTQRLGSVQFPLSVAVNGNTFTLAADDGTIVALDADTGRDLWRASVGAKLSAGVGSDGRFASVVTRDGEIVTLEAGRVLWRKPLGLRVNTAPLVAGERVFVLAADRSVHAFDALDGRKLWSVQRPGDPLTLSQAGVITSYRDTLVVGQGPRLAGLDPNDGSVRWDVAVAAPRGTNEVERLADLVSPPRRVGELICARSFQAAVGCVNAERGTLAWSRNVGGTDGVAADAQWLVAADATDRVSAWRVTAGDTAWSTDALMYRGLGTPLMLGPTVVFGDAEGLVHFLAADSGRTRLRLNTDGSPISVPPVLAGSTMLIVTRNGGVFALRPQ